MRTKVINRLSAVFVILGMLFWLTAGLMLHGFAAGKGSISMVCASMEGQLLPGMQWRIYHVADRNAEGEFVLQGGFSKYSIRVDDSSDSALADTAQTLAVYADLDNTIVPVAEKKADAQGNLVFEDLSDGMYLVCGDSYKAGDVYYIPSPFMIEMTAAGDQDYNMMVNPKYAVRSEKEGGFDYTVRKFWANDETQPQNRSVYITVEIYRDGELYDTVTLDEGNDWTYAWHSDSVHDWSVVEKVVPWPYIVTYRYNELQYVIVNTLTDDSSIVDTNTTPTTDDNATDTMTTTSFTGVTDASETSTTVSGTTSDTKKQTTARSTTTRTTTVTPGGTGKGEKLPQTGQLWWPVPALAAAGLILMAVGLRLRPKE